VGAPQAKLTLRNLYSCLDRDGLEQELNSLDNQREASEAYYPKPGPRGLEADPESL
jgi:hypothetical protein